MDVGDGRGVTDSNQPVATFHQGAGDHLNLCVFEGLVSKFDVRQAGAGDVAKDVERPFRLRDDKSWQGRKALMH